MSIAGETHFGTQSGSTNSGEYIGESTNQRAEIIAVARGLESLKEPCTVIVRSDSRYVVETMKGEFKRRTNHDCWTRLDAAAQNHQVTYEWVKGHNGDPEQEAADTIARKTTGLPCALSSTTSSPV